jgi:hypothetical protein
MAGGAFMLLAAVLAQWVKAERAETLNIEPRANTENQPLGVE